MPCRNHDHKWLHLSSYESGATFGWPSSTASIPSGMACMCAPLGTSPTFVVCRVVASSGRKGQRHHCPVSERVGEAQAFSREVTGTTIQAWAGGTVEILALWLAGNVGSSSVGPEGAARFDCHRQVHGVLVPVVVGNRHGRSCGTCLLHSCMFNRCSSWRDLQVVGVAACDPELPCCSRLTLAHTSHCPPAGPA
jgi:hypothetical protein